MKSLAKCVFVVVLVFQCAQTVLGCTSCYCRSYRDYIPDGDGGTCTSSGCTQQCAGPMHQEATEVLVPGFRVGYATL